jgi:hypothetical protein
MAIPAILLSVAIRWLESKTIAQPVIYGLEAAEYFLFAIDLLLFGYFVVRAALRAAKEL